MIPYTEKMEQILLAYGLSKEAITELYIYSYTYTYKRVSLVRYICLTAYQLLMDYLIPNLDLSIYLA